MEGNRSRRSHDGDDEEENLKFCDKCKKHFVEYCKSTSIHGIHYMGEQNRTVCEKIWWFIIITISFTYCSLHIIHSYREWENSPIVVTFATTEKPIWEIPFPAITICPQVKSDPDKFNYTKMWHRKADNLTLSPEDEVHFDYISLICGHRPELNYTLPYVKNDDIFDFYENVTSHITKDPFYVTFLNKELHFNSSFSQIFTDDGLCYTFNMLDREEIYTNIVKHYKDYHKNEKNKNWNLENGYRKYSGKSVYPRRIGFAGVPSSFFIELHITSSDVDYSCTGGFQGYKVQIHHPADVPHFRQQHFFVPLDHSVMATVEPRMITTMESAKSYNWKKRGCYFSSERKLKYFRFYTQNNCEIECFTNVTLERCGCVNFYMPRDISTHICGGFSLKCLGEVADHYLNDFDIPENTESAINKCECLPDCTSTTYSVDLSQMDYDWVNEFKAERYKDTVNYKEFTKENYRVSTLTVFYKTKQFIPSERRVLMSFTDLLANFGGLLGLFVGFSVISLIELIYFLTVHIWCNINK